MTVLTKGVHSSLLPLRSGGWIMSGMAVNVGKMALLLTAILWHLHSIFQVSSEKEANEDDSLLQTGQSALFCHYMSQWTLQWCVWSSFTQTMRISALWKNWVHGGHRKVLPSGMYCTFHIVKTAKCFLILIAKFVSSDFIWVHPACAVAFLLGIYHYLSIQVLFEYWIIDNFHTPNRGVNSAHSGPDNNVIIYSIFDLLHMNMRGLPLDPNRVWHMNWGRNHSFVLALAFPAGQRKDLIFALCFQHRDNRRL